MLFASLNLVYHPECYSQAIYRTLSDEPDGMVGLDVMRGAAGVAATLKQRTWQLEHAEDWAGALEVITLCRRLFVSSSVMPWYSNRTHMALPSMVFV